MKAADLKRALVLLLLVCLVLMGYFFSQQTTRLGLGQHLDGPVEPAASTSFKPDVRWTWTCTNKHCEKSAASSVAKRQSLTTCNMLCGNTQLWPVPTITAKLGSTAISFSLQQLQAETTATQPALAFLHEAYDHFNSTIVSYVKRNNSSQTRGEIDSFIVKISVLHEHITRLRMKTDESYNLTLKPQGGTKLLASIQANTVFGARHGLETLSQLIWWDEFDSGGTLKVLSDAHISDKPTFAYRGIMLDTARNFISLNGIKRIINGMAANKLNVFHWHVSDSQSFPLEIPSVPQMHMFGAYHAGMVYSAEDVKNLVEYARVRGIRVVIEVDTPAHAGNGWTWGSQLGLGELAVCVNAQPWYMYCGEPPCGQLNPENPQVYEILERIYRDIIKLTGEDEIFHIGGDEVNLDCWEQHLMKNFTSNNYTDLHNLWGDFTLKILNRLEKANGGKRPPYVVTWSSNLSRRPYNSKFLNKDSITVQTWGASDWSETRELITDGYKVILSHVNAWYLDCGFGRWRERGEGACDPYRTWQTVYLHQPWAFDPDYKAQTVGAEVCLWSEQVDELSLDARLWPRAAAFAERVWSDPPLDQEVYNIAEDVYVRLTMQRDRLISRGLGVEALWPKWCTQNPGMCL